ncbi:deoxyribonuclease [Alishewanella phage vB_AspM_Slicko01]|nr:deoxyribonuclease [Alishewanella phage vB_AspM_Slicko01]
MNFSDLYEDQQVALIQILDFLINKNSKIIVFKAPAGCGKTTVLKVLAKVLSSSSNKISFMAFAGRAASQLSKSGLDAGTCHSYLYDPVIDSKGVLLRWTAKDRNDIKDRCGNFIAVDEGSMINEKMHNEITSIGLPVIYCGDYDQLEPVDIDSSNKFNPMETLDAPTVTLSTIRRFDEQSGIGFVAKTLRKENTIPRIKMDGLKFITRTRALNIQFHKENQFDVIVCGTNKFRKSLNDLVRRARGLNDYKPMVGERIVCLKNDVVDGKVISNGELFDVIGINKIAKDVSSYFIKGVDRDISLLVKVPDETWITETISPEYNKSNGYNLFSYGYALSCHKVQGSSFERVLFIDEDVSYFLDRRRFRYTACSRAVSELTIAI